MGSLWRGERLATVPAQWETKRAMVCRRWRKQGELFWDYAPVATNLSRDDPRIAQAMAGGRRFAQVIWDLYSYKQGLENQWKDLLRDLSLLAEAGMSPQRVLRAPTSEAASFLGRPRLGRVSPGCRADLVVVKGDPTRQIPEEPEIVTVVQNGTILKPCDLFEAAEQTAPTVTEDPCSVQFGIRRLGA